MKKPSCKVGIILKMLQDLFFLEKKQIKFRQK